ALRTQISSPSSQMARSWPWSGSKVARAVSIASSREAVRATILFFTVSMYMVFAPALLVGKGVPARVGVLGSSAESSQQLGQPDPVLAPARPQTVPGRIRAITTGH